MIDVNNIKIETVVDELLKLVDEKVRNEEETHFLVKGDLASILCRKRMGFKPMGRR